MATHRIPASARRWNRSQIEEMIEGLIALLDEQDGDPDLEEGDPAEDDDPGGGNVEDEFQGDVSVHVGLFGFVDESGPRYNRITDVREMA